MLGRAANATQIQPAQTVIAPPRPLVTIQTVMDIGGIGEDQAVALADSGQILAFDIRAPRAHRRLLRFYWKSFLLWHTKAPPRDYNLEAVIQQIIGVPRDTIAAANFARAIRACPTHVINLIDSKTLRAVTRPRRGPLGSPKIVYSSAADFLRKACLIFAIEAPLRLD